MTKNRKILVAALILMGLCCVSIVVALFVNNQKLNLQTNTPTPLFINTSAPAADLFNQNQTGDSNSAKRNIPLQSVVLITALYYENGSLEVGWTGSGTFVSKDGLILTNAHVVLSDEDFKVDVLTIAPTKSADEKPMPAYIAKVIQADAQLDLAILKITTDLNGNPVDTSTLNFPAVKLGDSNKITLGDKLTILGYPGIGGDTITLTSGEVAGFTSEAGYGSRAFIKTSATIAGGNSGGLAADEAGRLVGIPTQLGSGGDSNIVDCRYLADTNNDGYIDADDTCIPTGGFINSLRPVNLAIPMIEAARRGAVNIISSTAVVEQPTQRSGGITHSDDFSNSDSNWTIASDSSGAVGYYEGNYLIQVTSPGQVITGTSGINAGDVVIEISAQVIQSTGSGDYGIICRSQTDGSYYAFEVNENGHASIWKSDSETSIPLVDWKFFQSLEGTAVRNLRAACIGNQLSLSVNGNLLMSTTDQDFQYGDSGLVAGTWDTGGLIVAFDNFQIRTAD